MTNPQVDEQICRQCGGLCCQGHAGAWVDPQRFKRLFFEGEEIDRQRLPEGVALRALGGIEVATPKTLEQGCTFLTPQGCSLSQALRPCQCLALQPNIETLLEGEICCSLPPTCGSQTARENWRRYWETDRHQEHNGEKIR